MKAIETEYKGVLFRSRLEARWALFFDTLGVKWMYEHEGYELPSGKYVPDFYLPAYRNHVEIKGQYPTLREIALCVELNDEKLRARTGGGVYIASGDPLSVFLAAERERGQGCWEARWRPGNEHGFKNDLVRPMLCFRCRLGRAFTFSAATYPAALVWSCCDACWNRDGISAPEAMIAAYETGTDERAAHGYKAACSAIALAAKTARTHRFWNPRGRR